MKHANILIVEDEFIIALEMKKKLEKQGYEAFTVSSGEKAIEFVKATPPDVILMDVVLMDGMSGIETAVKIHRFCDIPIIYVTGNSNMREDIMLLDPQAFAILTKPPMEVDILGTIESALQCCNEELPPIKGNYIHQRDKGTFSH